MRGRRALSLIETMIAMALSTLLLGVVLSIFSIGKNLFLSSLERARVTRLSHLLPRQLVHCLEMSSAESILAGENVLACLSAYDGLGEFRTGSDGRPDWQTQLTYFVPLATQELRLHQGQASQDGSLVLHIPPLLPKQGRILASGVEGLQLLPQEGSNRLLLVLHLRLEERRRVYREEVRTWITPLN